MFCFRLKVIVSSYRFRSPGMSGSRFSHPFSKGDLVQVQDWCMQTLKQVEDYEKKARIYQLGSRVQEPSEDLKRRVSMLCQPSSLEVKKSHIMAILSVGHSVCVRHKTYTCRPDPSIVAPSPSMICM